MNISNTVRKNEEKNHAENAEIDKNSNYFSNEYDRIGVASNFTFLHKDSLEQAFLPASPQNESLRFIELSEKLRSLSSEERDWMFNFIKSYYDKGFVIKTSSNWRVSNYGF